MILSANRWLSELDCSFSGPEMQVQRAFGGLAAAMVAGQSKARVKGALLKTLDSVPSFDASSYSGDPICVLAISVAAVHANVEHRDCSELALTYSTYLGCVPRPLSSDLALAYYLLKQCGMDVRGPVARDIKLPAPAELINASRSEVLKSCRSIANVSAWGRLKIGSGDFGAVLPALALSYAREWDIEMVCTLLRTCSYLGLSLSKGCRWCLEWLLDQQQDDGRFGWLAPEASRMKVDTGDWRFYFDPTISAMWTLSELSRPGFVLADHW